MATRSLLLSKLRRCRPLSSFSHLYTNPSSSSKSFTSQPAILPSRNSLASFYFPFRRSFSTRNSDIFSPNSLTESQTFNVEQHAAAITEGVSNGILPTDALISLLDSYHDLTGLPWWIVIASSTLAMRMALFPLYVLQLRKIKKILECNPKLPPLFPQPMSGRSYLDQFSLFRKERQAMGCPSYLWFGAYLSLQLPCFLLWISSIRRMSLDSHPGFDCGGTLWFQNLTELPHGVLAPIFPFLIACLHWINVQVSLNRSSVQKMRDPGLLSDLYNDYLKFLTLPLFFVAYCIPQGSLVYWVTNSSLTAIQQASLKHLVGREKLGLLDKDSSKAPIISEETVIAESASSDSQMKWREISPENLSSHELLALSVKFLSMEHRDRAITFLRMSLSKDPDNLMTSVILGQTLLQEGLHAEAVNHFEGAISNLILAGYPTAKDVDLLIAASRGAGAACIQQGKNAEGIAHLERVASLEEPENPRSKAHYFGGLLLLARTLISEVRKDEALKYLRLVVAYDPSYKQLLEKCENDEGDLVKDLVSGR